MKVKPKELLVNLPIVLLMDSEDEVAKFASNINTLIHGKVKVKTDVLGVLGEKTVSIFYLQRNDEYHSIRDSFMDLINQEMMSSSSDQQMSSDESDKTEDHFDPDTELAKFVYLLDALQNSPLKAEKLLKNGRERVKDPRFDSFFERLNTAANDKESLIDEVIEIKREIE